MEVDPYGTFVLSAIFWGFIIGFAISFTVSIVSQAIENDGKLEWEDVGVALVEGLFGGVSGALAATGIGAAASFAIDLGLDFVCNTITTGIENDWDFDSNDWACILLSTGISAVSSSLVGKIGPDLDRSFIKNANKTVKTINSKTARGAYKSLSKLTRATNTAQSLVKQCFKKAHLTEEFIRRGVLNIFDAIIGGIAA